MAVNDQDYAIVIGINAYPQLRPLKAAHKDATAFAEWLVSDTGGGVPIGNIVSMISPKEAKEQPNDPSKYFPLRGDIDKAIEKLGIKKLQKIGRRLYFYFSGHGVGPHFDEVAMLMASAAMNNLNSNIGMRGYRNLLRLVAAFEEVVFILDCCRDPAPKAANFIPMPPEFTPLLDKPLGPVDDFVVMAAEYGEKAFEPSDPGTGERRGLLTKALLEGLKGKAADPKGEVTAFSLREYLLRRVEELATDAKMKQPPKIESLPSKEMVFAKVAPAAIAETVKVRIIAPAGLTGNLVLIDSTDKAIIDQQKADDVTKDKPPWEKDLQRNRRYELEHTDSDVVAVIDPSKAKEKTYVFRFPRPE